MAFNLLVKTVGDKMLFDSTTNQVISKKRPHVVTPTSFIESRSKPNDRVPKEILILANKIPEEFTDEEFAKEYDRLGKEDEKNSKEGKATDLQNDFVRDVKNGSFFKGKTFSKAHKEENKEVKFEDAFQVDEQEPTGTTPKPAGGKEAGKDGKAS